jgi:hypothetical protein
VPQHVKVERPEGGQFLVAGDVSRVEGQFDGSLEPVRAAVDGVEVAPHDASGPLVDIGVEPPVDEALALLGAHIVHGHAATPCSGNRTSSS